MASTDRYRLYRTDNGEPFGKAHLTEDDARRVASRFIYLTVEVWRVNRQGSRVELVAEYGGGRAA